MRSLQTQLSTGLIVALIVVMTILLAIAGYSLRHLTEEFVVTRLEHDMDALLVALTFDEAGRPLLNLGRVNPIFNQPYSGHYYKLKVDSHELRSRSLWDTDLTIPSITTANPAREFVPGPQDQVLLLLAQRFRVQDKEIALAVSEDFTPLANGLRRIMISGVIVTALLLAALIGLQRLIVLQGLKPFEATRRDMLRLAQGEIQQLKTDVPVEVQPLIAEINRLIQLTSQRLQRSRHALGNLAHSLKAPLTILMQLAEHPEVKHQDNLCGELGRQTQRIRLLVERELKRARIAGMATPGQRVILNEEIASLVDTLGKIYRDKGLAIECRIPPHSAFPGDRDDLLELLGNLLDNACQWAAHAVRLTVTATSKQLCFEVEDDGPGCAPEQLALLTQRGARVDESRRGHGLGLAIVTAIVDQYGGRLNLGRSPDLGGFLAEVEIPILTSGYAYLHSR